MDNEINVRRYTVLLVLLVLFLVSCEKKREKDTVEYLQDRINRIVNQTNKSIVTVYNTHLEKIKFIPDNEFDDESIGSGFVIKKDLKYLYIVTNAHVVEKSKSIKVKFYNNRSYKAELAGLDEKTDIAVIKVSIHNPLRDIAPLSLAREKTVKIGSFVLAVGSPYNLGTTYTLGIVSAVDRDVGISPFEGYIQTDASMNPGDSGGPLLDMNGQVIGINVAVVQSGQGLGFAIPVDVVKYVVNQIVKYGKLERGYIGITVDDLSEEQREKLNVDSGVLVVRVQKNSPAMKAGLKSGDVIIKLNGELIHSVKKLNRILLEIKPNQMVELEILRNSQKITINLITQTE
ncbi:MAG: trypsin-like peptidase domain-containing protein [Hydrogenothermaceae bacterium]|nr:trypsin-like peptidase domain-containing protein [Hydrogenothermaceae bacterium]